MSEEAMGEGIVHIILIAFFALLGSACRLFGEPSMAVFPMKYCHGKGLVRKRLLDAYYAILTLAMLVWAVVNMWIGAIKWYVAIPEMFISLAVLGGILALRIFGPQLCYWFAWIPATFFAARGWYALLNAWFSRNG